MYVLHAYVPKYNGGSSFLAEVTVEPNVLMLYVPEFIGKGLPDISIESMLSV
jgi:hypothetical protein